MAVPEQTPYIEHTGNGVTTSFSLGFQCESKDHLIVLVDEIEPPIATWSLIGGNVVFTTAPAAGKKITLQRNTPFGRTTNYQSFNNSFRPQTVNTDFDRIWLKLQELGVADWLMKLYVDRLHQQQEEKINNLKGYVDDRDDELRAYLMEEIRKQGVALDQLDEYYNYLMQRLAQIAVDKGWDASFVVDGDKNQKQINAALMDGNAYVEFFGDTTGDATNAINMCLLYCLEYNKKAKSIPNKTYPISGTIVIPTSCDFSGSKFVFPNTISSAAIEIKRLVDGVQRLSENVSIKLPQVTNDKIPGVIPVPGSIGVKVSGLRDSEIVFNSINGFEDNLQLYSNNLNIYIAYNEFKFNGLFVSSKVNIHMLIEGQGWINQCTWHGGHFAQYSTDRQKYPAINLKLTKLAAGGNNPPNGHTFIGCALEGDFSKTIDYDFDPSLSVSYYSCNTFLNCRFEAVKAIRLNRHALYDTFVCCSGLSDAVFEDDVRPNAVGSPRFTNFKMDVAALPTDVSFRTSRKTHFFQCGNSSGAIVLAAGFDNRINGGFLGSGAFVVFNPQNPDLNYPVIKASFDGGRPALRMGGGTTEPDETLFRFNQNDWRHTFSLSPSANNTNNLGAADRQYANIFSVKGIFSGGIGVFGTNPPTAKCSITGKKAPTTIAEQNAVLDSIVSALVAYGLVSDDRTV